MTDDAPAEADGAAGRPRRRVFGAILGSLDAQVIYLGERLGLYQALADGGPATARSWRACRHRCALRPRVARAPGGRRRPRRRRRRCRPDARALHAAGTVTPRS